MSRWKSGRWQTPKDEIFEDIPPGKLPVKKIYVDEDGKLVVVYDDVPEKQP